MLCNTKCCDCFTVLWLAVLMWVLLLCYHFNSNSFSPPICCDQWDIEGRGCWYILFNYARGCAREMFVCVCSDVFKKQTNKQKPQLCQRSKLTSGWGGPCGGCTAPRDCGWLPAKMRHLHYKVNTATVQTASISLPYAHTYHMHRRAPHTRAHSGAKLICK